MIFIYLANVKEHAPPPLESEGAETEKLDGGCCVSSCSLLSSSGEGVSFSDEVEQKMYRDMGIPESLYPPRLYQGDPSCDDK